MLQAGFSGRDKLKRFLFFLWGHLYDCPQYSINNNSKRLKKNEKGCLNIITHIPNVFIQVLIKWAI